MVLHLIKGCRFLFDFRDMIIDSVLEELKDTNQVAALCVILLRSKLRQFTETTGSSTIV